MKLDTKCYLSSTNTSKNYQQCGGLNSTLHIGVARTNERDTNRHARCHYHRL